MSTQQFYSSHMTQRRSEEDIPNEGSQISEDDRLQDKNYISQVRITEKEALISSKQVGGQTENIKEGIEDPNLRSSLPSEVIAASGLTVKSSEVQGANLQAEKIIQEHLPSGVRNTEGAQPIVGEGETESVERKFATPEISPIQRPTMEEVGSHLKDSPTLPHSQINKTNTQLHQSLWEVQQMEISKMRQDTHQNFEVWEEKRNSFVSERLTVTDDLLAGMEKKLVWLEEGVEKVIKFFKERETQEMEYSKTVKHGLPQLGEHFSNTLQPGLSTDFTQGMKENDQFHTQQKKNSDILANLIQKNILDWMLYPSEKEYKLQAGSLRVPLYAHRKKLESAGNTRAKYYTKYFKLYDATQKNSGKPLKKEDGMFRRQLKYSLAAREEIRMLKLYNEQALLVINEFTRLSISRLAEVQKAFSLYLQKYTELYQNSATTPEPILELIEGSNNAAAVENIFSVRNLLQLDNYETLTKKFNRQEVDYPDIQEFLVNLHEYVDPAHSSFVLKEWEAMKQGTLLKKPTLCTVIATIDKNILIVERGHEEKEIGKVMNPLHLIYTKVEDVEASGDGTLLKVVERAPGTVFTHKTKTTLKFETPEEARDFLHYVNNSQSAGDV
jgi:hypothetical protein